MSTARFQRRYHIVWSSSSLKQSTRFGMCEEPRAFQEQQGERKSLFKNESEWKNMTRVRVLAQRT